MNREKKVSTRDMYNGFEIKEKTYFQMFVDGNKGFYSFNVRKHVKFHSPREKLLIMPSCPPNYSRLDVVSVHYIPSFTWVSCYSSPVSHPLVLDENESRKEGEYERCTTGLKLRKKKTHFHMFVDGNKGFYSFNVRK